MKTLCATLLLAFALAAASGFPRDAGVLVTADDGTIVGIGSAAAGEAFELELMTGFTGFGTMIVTTPDGDTRVLPVTIGDAGISVELTDLPELLRASGFEDVRITRGSPAPAASGRADPAPAGRPDDPGRSGEAPRSEPAGADDADDRRGDAPDRAGGTADDADERDADERGDGGRSGGERGNDERGDGGSDERGNGGGGGRRP